jgi:hypothetical protein
VRPPPDRTWQDLEVSGEDEDWSGGEMVPDAKRRERKRTAAKKAESTAAKLAGRAMRRG